MNAIGISRYESIDEIQHWILRTLLSSGLPASPRGLETLELEAVAFCLVRPRRRCVTNPSRKWSLPLAVGEFCWHLSGSNDASFLEYYSRAWKSFANEKDQIVGSCYGRTIFGPGENGHHRRWDHLKELLIADPETRRAVIFLGANDRMFQNDIACASLIQFLVRDGKLNATVYMRSNDSIWGLPYDVFLFTMLQELLATELGLELGVYYHFAASMHLYRRHIQLAERIITERAGVFQMPALERPNEIPQLLDYEKSLRLGDEIKRSHGLSKYWADLAEPLLWYRAQKNRDPIDLGRYLNPYSIICRDLASSTIVT